MKKVFLAVLAAGLFFACSNDTKDKANEEQVPETETETTIDEPAPAPETTATVETPDPEKKDGVKVSANKDGEAKVESEGVSVEANKDGNVELKVNTKGKSSKGNR